ncbi:hypothetical protein CBR_g41106 [Chara braunii]|uniref:Uncharacterized protein n=1 Tax=Chara braunii TaxID=69332 RepID=A0A388LVH1_CHABU|nr:hypothetical protein CBR_g41106 [Chara braunii]|eukprot:GBG86202.1 hypothetical protein CBR_g41106 [Chara braunii]
MGIVRTDICATFVDGPQGDEDVDRRHTMAKGGPGLGEKGGEELVERRDEGGDKEAPGLPHTFQMSLEASLPVMPAPSPPDSLPSSLPPSRTRDGYEPDGAGFALEDLGAMSQRHADAAGNAAGKDPSTPPLADRVNGSSIAHLSDLGDIDRVDPMGEVLHVGQECKGPEQPTGSPCAGTLSPLSSYISEPSHSPYRSSFVSPGHSPDQRPSPSPSPGRSPSSNSSPLSPAKPKRSLFKFTFPKPAGSPQSVPNSCSPGGTSTTTSAGITTPSPSARRGSSALFPGSSRPDEGKRVRKDDDGERHERLEGTGSYVEGGVNTPQHHGGRATLSSCAMPSHVEALSAECCDRGSRASFQMASPSYPSPSLPPPAAPSLSSSSSGAAVNLFPSMRSNTGLTNEKMVYELLHNPDWQFPASPGRSGGGVHGSKPNSAARGTGDVGTAAAALSISSSGSNPFEVTKSDGRSPGEGSSCKSPAKGHAGGDGQKLRITGSLSELHARVRQIMEDAFWDTLRFHLLSDPPDFSRVVTLVEEIREELLSLASERMKEEICAKMDTKVLTELLNSSRLDFGYMRGLLDFVADLMLKLGAPARDDESRSEHQRLLLELSASVNLAAITQDGKSDDAVTAEHEAAAKKAFADAVVNGFRFVFDRLQVLKLDISNARLRAVSRVINSAAGVGYLRMQFAKQHGLQGPDDDGGTPLADGRGLPVFDALLHRQPSPLEWQPRCDQREQIRSRLLRTCQWMTETAEEIGQIREEVDVAVAAISMRRNSESMEQEANGAATGSSSNTNTHHQGARSSSPTPLNVPAAMRTGVRGLVKDPSFGARPGSLRSYTDSVEAGMLEAKPGKRSSGAGGPSTESASVRWQSVETLVRVGLVMVVRGAEGAEEGRLAETLRLEVVRIRNLQDQFQCALVTAAGLLMVQQVLVSRGYSAGSNMSAIMSRGKAEMLRMLDDRTASVDKIGGLLGDLVVAASEMMEASSTGARSSGRTTSHIMGGVMAEAEMMTRMLARALQPEDLVFKCMVASISTAVRWLVLLDGGKRGPGHLPAATALQRAGATLLMDKVEELAAGIRKIAKINALVYEPWYRVCLP